MDRFDVTCPRCNAEIAVSVPHLRDVRPFTCPGCERTLTVDDHGAAMPAPQHDTSDSPATQARVLNFRRDQG